MYGNRYCLDEHANSYTAGSCKLLQRGNWNGGRKGGCLELLRVDGAHPGGGGRARLAAKVEDRARVAGEAEHVLGAKDARGQRAPGRRVEAEDGEEIEERSCGARLAGERLENYEHVGAQKEGLDASAVLVASGEVPGSACSAPCAALAPAACRRRPRCA